MPRPLLRTYRNQNPIPPEEQDAIAASTEFNPLQRLGQNIIDVGSGALAGALGLGDYTQKPWAEANPYERAGGTAQIITSLLPALGITRFLKKSPTGWLGRGEARMVPDIAAREASTRAFVDAYRQRGMGDVGAEIASTHPRVAAHADVDDILPPRFGERESVGSVTVGKRQKMPFYIKFKGRTPEEVKKTSYHELTHVAQGLGQDADLNQTLYNKMNKFPVTTGQMDDWDAYINNPFEVSARNVAERKTDPTSMIGVSPTRSIAEIKNYLDTLSPEMRARFIKEVQNEYDLHRRLRRIPGLLKFVDEPNQFSFKSDMMGSVLTKLDEKKAADIEYKKLLPPETKLKKGETWRSKVMDFIGKEKSLDKPEKKSFLKEIIDNPFLLDDDPRVK